MNGKAGVTRSLWTAGLLAATAWLAAPAWAASAEPGPAQTERQKPKVSPYAKANRQRAQAAGAAQGKGRVAPQAAPPHAVHKPSGHGSARQ